MRRDARGRNQKRRKLKNADIDYTKANKILISTVICLFVILLAIALFYYVKNG